MVLKIAKETWEKCGIKTINHYNEKEDMFELQNKMSHIEIQLGHSFIYHIALERIKKCCDEKTKEEEEEKNIYKAFFEGETGIFIIEKLTRDITERCKLAEAME